MKRIPGYESKSARLLQAVMAKQTGPVFVNIDPPERDCKHGNLARSCEICDLLAENERLRAALARTAAFVDVEILKHNKIGEDLAAALAGGKGEK